MSKATLGLAFKLPSILHMNKKTWLYSVIVYQCNAVAQLKTVKTSVNMMSVCIDLSLRMFCMSLIFALQYFKDNLFSSCSRILCKYSYLSFCIILTASLQLLPWVMYSWYVKAQIKITMCVKMVKTDSLKKK